MGTLARNELMKKTFQDQSVQEYGRLKNMPKHGFSASKTCSDWPIKKPPKRSDPSPNYQ